MTQKNQTVVAKCEGLGTNGEGIFRHEGVTYFVPYCLPGEEVKFRVLKVKGSIGYGKIEEVLSASERRVEPKCPAFLRCGGCQLQHAAYEEQLAFKARLVADTLQKIAGIEADVSKAIPSKKEYGYRNKLQLPIGVDKEGNTVVGFYAERSHRIVPIESCAIHPEWAKRVISAVKDYASVSGEKGYDEEKKTGLLRHIVVRDLGKKYVVTLVARTEKLKRIEYFIEAMGRALGTFTLWLNVNQKDTNAVFGEKFTLLHGKGFFEAEEKGIVYEAGPQTFVQVNADVRGGLYDYALETVTGDGDEVVVDAYSGGGLLTAMIAKRAKRAYGIEIVQEAVDCANELKKKNVLENMTNICGAVENELPAVLQKEKGEKVRLVLDPPRAGIARSVLQALIESGIPQLTIISCNPATLARDLGILTGFLKEENGELKKSDGRGVYEITEIKAFDMFPQTRHVESVVCLERREK